jgi:hypothetical protein
VPGQRLRDDSNKPFGHEGMQTAIAFPSAPAAQKAFADQAARWPSYAGRSFTVGAPSPTQHRTFGMLSNKVGTLAISSTLDAPCTKSANMR